MIFAIRSIFKPGKPQPPERNEAYKRWIRRFPCVGCGVTRRIESAHTGDHGLSQKASDLSCIPLCEECHRTGKYAYHKGRVDFEQVHDCDVDQWVKFFQGMWENKKAA